MRVIQIVKQQQLVTPIQGGSENEVTDTGTNEACGEPITDIVNLFIIIPITNLSCVVIIPYIYM